MSWKLAPSLSKLFADINDEWPKRDRSTDGSLGDASHAARASEHNPNRNPKDDVPDGYVTAIDVDKDGINVNLLIKILKADPRVWYVIHNRTIWSRTHGFVARAYTGANPHLGHIHVSLVQSKAACNSTKAWLVNLPVPKPEVPKPPVKPVGPLPFPGWDAFKLGARSGSVTVLGQWLVKVGFGKHTAGAVYTPGPEMTVWDRANVKDFQRAQSWSGPSAVGDVGPATWDRLQSLARAKGWKP